MIFTSPTPIPHNTYKTCIPKPLRKERQLGIKGMPKKEMTEEQRQLVEEHRMLGKWWVKRLSWHTWVKALGDDAFGVTQIAMIHASFKFNPERKVKFTTYASWWIRRYLFVEGKRAYRHGFTFTDLESSSIFSKHGQDPMPVEPQDHREEDPGDKASSHLDTMSHLAQYRKWYRDDEWYLLMQHYGYNRTLDDLAEEIGLTKERIRQKLLKLTDRAIKLRWEGRV